MTGAVRLVRIAGIPVRIHWTFGLLLLWVAFYAFNAGLDVLSVLLALGILMVLFSCVILHEYGHALTARRFGVETRDIIVSPIGGLARLSHIPENPWQEMAIAIAGPLVNLAIASFILLPVALASGGQISPFNTGFWDWDAHQSVLILIAKINLILMLFNLVPAFPMDGGRVFRALACLFLTRTRATLYASLLGYIFGASFIGIYLIELSTGQPVEIMGVRLSGFITALIGVFVIIAARGEFRQTQFKEKLKSTTIGTLVSSGIPLVSPETAIAEVPVFDGVYQDVLIMQEGKATGVVFREALERAFKLGLTDYPVSDIASDFFEDFNADQSVLDALEAFANKGYRIVPVYDNNGFSGALTRKTLEDLMP